MLQRTERRVQAGGRAVEIGQAMQLGGFLVAQQGVQQEQLAIVCAGQIAGHRQCFVRGRRAVDGHENLLHDARSSGNSVLVFQDFHRFVRKPR